MNAFCTCFRELTSIPHLAGTPADEEQADLLVKFWEDAGLKGVKVPYNVLLSYPDKNNPNRIELQDGSGNVLFTTQLEEKIVRPEQNHPDVVPPFNAFSAPGTPKVSDHRRDFGILNRTDPEAARLT